MDAETKIADVIANENFKGYGQLLFPGHLSESDKKRTLGQIAPLFPYHRHLSVDVTLNVLNSMLAREKNGEKIFYDLYSDREKDKDPGKAETGLFYFRGVKKAPFAVICAGGSFQYVASLHESLPHALELSRMGFNAFTLHYRTESLEAACEDLAVAITQIFTHVEEFNVGTECYSLWGSSVGAHVAAYLASYGPHGFGGAQLPRPGTLVLQYTGHTNHTRQEPPTYVCVGENDPVCDWRVMKKRLDALAACGIDTEFHKYPHLGHGFGLGIGTEAEGWIASAAAFWKRHLPRRTLRVLSRFEAAAV